MEKPGRPAHPAPTQPNQTTKINYTTSNSWAVDPG